LGRCKQMQRGLRGYYVAGSPLLNGRCKSLLRALVSEMTYTVSSGTLNSSIPYHLLRYLFLQNPHFSIPISSIIIIKSNSKQKNRQIPVTWQLGCRYQSWLSRCRPVATLAPVSAVRLAYDAAPCPGVPTPPARARRSDWLSPSPKPAWLSPEPTWPSDTTILLLLLLLILLLMMVVVVVW